MLGYLSNEEDGGYLIAGLKNSDFQKMYDQDQSSRMVMIPFNNFFLKFKTSILIQKKEEKEKSLLQQKRDPFKIRDLHQNQRGNHSLMFEISRKLNF